MKKNSLLLILLSIAIAKQAKAQDVNLKTISTIRITKKDVKSKTMLTCGAAGFIAGTINKRVNEDNVSSEATKKEAKIIILNLFLASIGISMYIDTDTDSEIGFKNIIYSTAVITGGLFATYPNLLYGASAGLIAGRGIGIIIDSKHDSHNKFQIIGMSGGFIAGAICVPIVNQIIKKRNTLAP